jgi:predicted outer membrane protein
MRTRFSSSVAMTVAFLAAAIGMSMVACSDDEPIDRRPVAGMSSSGVASARRDTSEFTGDVATDSSATRPAVRWLTDANVLSLLSLMNSREIAAADVELESWHLDNVREFASVMAREHAEIQHSIDSVAERTRIAPAAPALAQAVTAKMQPQIDSLRWTTARSLDRAFVRQQVASHEFMANYIADLTSVAERPELQALLASAGQRVANQVVRARGLLASIAAADSIARADSAAKVAAKLAAKRTRGAVPR